MKKLAIILLTLAIGFSSCENRTKKAIVTKKQIPQVVRIINIVDLIDLLNNIDDMPYLFKKIDSIGFKENKNGFYVLKTTQENRKSRQNIHFFDMGESSFITFKTIDKDLWVNLIKETKEHILSVEIFDKEYPGISQRMIGLYYTFETYSPETASQTLNNLYEITVFKTEK